MSNLFIVDLVGKILTAEEEEIIAHPQVGGVILFTHNFENQDQLKKLITSIRKIRADIFVAVDQEGGFIQRFVRHGFSPAPAPIVFGQIYDFDPETAIKMARHWGNKVSAELIECGIDLNFAPVLDLHDPSSSIIGQLGRAFHAEPKVVALLAGAFIDGMREVGMPSVGKHFPGHGCCEGDSHIDLPVNHAAITVLKERDLQPFFQLITENKLDAIMAAHIVYPSVDSENPAGFSARWLKDILRDEFKFDGLVMSDCLSMKGADIGDMPTRVKRAVEAGCDMLILCQQSRAELLSFLKETQLIQTAASEQRIHAFKRRMRRNLVS